MSRAALDMLEIVPGVSAAFAATWSGDVLTHTFVGLSAEELAQICSTVVLLSRTARDSIGEYGQLSCAYEGHRLEVWTQQFGLICVLVDEATDLRLLSVVTRMITRKLLQPPPTRMSRPPPLS